MGPARHDGSRFLGVQELIDQRSIPLWIENCDNLPGKESSVETAFKFGAEWC